jgi:hypothetical protein
MSYELSPTTAHSFSEISSVTTSLLSTLSLSRRLTVSSPSPVRKPCLSVRILLAKTWSSPRVVRSLSARTDTPALINAVFSLAIFRHVTASVAPGISGASDKMLLILSMWARPQRAMSLLISSPYVILPSTYRFTFSMLLASNAAWMNCQLLLKSTRTPSMSKTTIFSFTFDFRACMRVASQTLTNRGFKQSLSVVAREEVLAR